MAALHVSQRGLQLGMHISRRRQDSRNISRKVIVFECVFCKTAHRIEASSGHAQDAHKAINDILDAGCNKCGGKITFKEHRAITS